MISRCSRNSSTLPTSSAPRSNMTSRSAPAEASTIADASASGAVRPSGWRRRHASANGLRGRSVSTRATFSSNGVDAAAVRFGGVFGPWHGVPGGGPSKLLKSLIECAFTGVPYQIAAPDLDRQGMDYTYSPDGAQAIVRAAYAERVPNRVYNATMGQLHTIREIIEVIEKVSDRPLNVEVVDQDSMTKYGNPTSAMDLSRSVEELGYKVEFPMETAVADYLQWLERTSTPR